MKQYAADSLKNYVQYFNIGFSDRCIQWIMGYTGRQFSAYFLGLQKGM
jgi:hypothetical protein